MDLKLDELTADSETLGLFICKERQHHYIEPINQRSNPNYDIGCPVCKAELLNISLFKAKQRIYRHPNFDLVENLWICKKCRKAWWSSRLSDDYVVTSHKEYCISDDDSAKPLYQTHPSIAEEYSESNPYDLEWISYSGWYGFDEPLKWKCSKCNHEYDMLFKRKVSFGDRACPYCNGILPTYEHSLAYLYPEIAEEWDKREQTLKISSKEIFGDKIGTRRAHGIEAMGMLQCKRCGVIHLRRIEDVINDKCSFCDQGATLEWTEKVFREKGIFSQDKYYCEFKAEAIVETFTCEECGNIFTANLMKRLTKKYLCLGCENRKVVPRYNSLDITHPKLASQWSSNNIKKATEVLKHSTNDALWICPVCKGEYSHPIVKRKEGDHVCPYCNDLKVLPGYNSLDVTHPYLAKEWSRKNKESARQTHKKSIATAIWNCSTCNGEYMYPIYKREENNKACPYCNNKKALAGFNSFKINHPELMSEWDYTNNYLLCNPDNILDTYDKKVWWICNHCGHRYVMSPKRRLLLQRRKMKACPYEKGDRRKKHYYYHM